MIECKQNHFQQFFQIQVQITLDVLVQFDPHPELFALELGKIAGSDFVYTLSSTNIKQSAPKLVKMYVIIRSPMSLMSLIMDLIGLELSELSALEFENLTYLTLFASANIDQSVPKLATTPQPRSDANLCNILLKFSKYFFRLFFVFFYSSIVQGLKLYIFCK